MDHRNSHIEEIREQAAEFIIEGDPSSPEDNARLQQWLSQSPKNVEEYLRMGGLWETLADPEVAPALRRAAATRWPTRYRWVAAAAAAVVLAVIGAGSWWLAVAPDVYRTAVGEVKSFQLEDRSVVFMNAASELAVNYTEAERRVVLAFGEAAFEVAKDPERPFIVESGSTRVIAVGTEFVVSRTNGRTTVTVLEGYVIVENLRDRIGSSNRRNPATVGDSIPVAGEPDPQPDRVVELGPNQRAVVGEQGHFEESTFLPDEEPAAWRERRLVFRGERLEDVVAEFNRFNALTISIDNPVLKDLRIGGVFDANDTDSLLAFLETLDGVDVHVDDDGSALLIRSE